MLFCGVFLGKITALHGRPGRKGVAGKGKLRRVRGGIRGVAIPEPALERRPGAATPPSAPPAAPPPHPRPLHRVPCCAGCGSCRPCPVPPGAAPAPPPGRSVHYCSPEPQPNPDLPRACLERLTRWYSPAARSTSSLFVPFAPARLPWRRHTRAMATASAKEWLQQVSTVRLLGKCMIACPHPRLSLGLCDAGRAADAARSLPCR